VPPLPHFTSGPVCTRLTAGGRVTLRGTRLIETRNGERHETEIAEEELLAVYREQFGVRLSRFPARSRS